MSKITPFLWFDNNAEEAINFYTSIFKDSNVGSLSRYPEGGPMPAGTVMTGSFEVGGQEFMVLNAGPDFKFNEAISMFIDCENQEEVDYYWNALIANGGEESQCGWLKDKFGLSWQVIPKQLGELMGGSDDTEASGRVMQCMMGMKKIIVADLEKAAAGE